MTDKYSNKLNKYCSRRYADMMYPFMTLNGETEIVHSDMQDDGRVKVYIETSDCGLYGGTI